MNIRTAQLTWAQNCGIQIDAAGYTRVLRDNLFQPLTDGALADLQSGDGSELGRHGGCGKMQALHSSSALACNVFDYWRAHDPKPLAVALGLTSTICEIRFERKFPTGIGPRSPNLDVVLTCSNAAVIAIESKFCEPYSLKTSRLSERYFAEGRALWDECGFEGCQRLALRIREERSSFRRLDAQQLLKHMLGLAQLKTDWTLVCLWFDDKSVAAVEHKRELDAFTEVANSSGRRFRALTYQGLFAGLASSRSGNDSYLSYLRERYFPDS